MQASVYNHIVISVMKSRSPGMVTNGRNSRLAVVKNITVMELTHIITYMYRHI